MNIIIRDTNTAQSLTIIDPATGQNYINDFIGNHDALNDGQFIWDADQDAYICSQETYDWWDKVVSDNQALDYRLHSLQAKHGAEAVWSAFKNVSVDLENHAAAVNQALDEAFGAE